MNYYKIVFIGFLGIIISCKSNTDDKKEVKSENETSVSLVKVQGHRGDRGNYPENSIPAFISAVKKGVDVLEMDVVISKDNKVVVSHEPFMDSSYMLKPNGDTISQEKERSYMLYEMIYDSIKSYDGGSKVNVRFPDQKKMETHKPLLSEVFDTVAAFIAKEDLPKVKYNIEIKSQPGKYGKLQPFPKEFVKLVMQVINKKELRERVIIQSFDPKVLNELHAKFPEIATSYLVSDAGIATNLSLLEFSPSIYSPNFKLVVNKAFVDSVHQRDMKLVPWTVNTTQYIDAMITLNVDGIISDHPERVLHQREMEQKD